MSDEPTMLAGGRLDRYYHACAFFRSADEEYEVTAPFVREGLERGEKAVHITAPTLRSDHLRRLAEAGVEVAGPEAAGQLEVLTWEEAYLRGGQFNADAMLSLLEEVLLRSTEAGFPRTRILGHMEWALEDRPGVDELLEYEARVNTVLQSHKQTAVCAYDLRRFSGEVIVDVLRTHPAVVLNGTLYENPFFVPPAQFLQELRERA